MTDARRQGQGHITAPMTLDQYVVIADYDKDGDNETSLKAGEIVDAVTKHTSGRYKILNIQVVGTRY